MEVARRAQHRVQTITVCAFEVATIHPVVCFQVADDQLNGLPAFEHLLFLLSQRLELAAVLNVDVQVDLVHAPVAQVDIGGFRLHAGLFKLLVQCVAVIRVAKESACADDQIALQRGGNAHLHTQLVRGAAFSLGDSIDFWCVPAVELALLAGRLRDQALGLAQRVTQSLLHRQVQGAHLAAHFTLQAAHDGALAWITLRMRLYWWASRNLKGIAQNYAKGLPSLDVTIRSPPGGGRGTSACVL